MILFLNTHRRLQDLIKLDSLSHTSLFDIHIDNRSLTDPYLIDDITELLDAFSAKEKNVLIVMNGMQYAFENLKDLQDESLYSRNKALFTGLLEQFIHVGHDIVFFMGPNKIDNEIEELAEIDGVDIIRDEVKLYQFIKSSIY